MRNMIKKIKVLISSIILILSNFSFAFSQTVNESISNALENSDILKSSSLQWAALNEQIIQSSAGNEIKGEISTSFKEGQSGNLGSFEDTHNHSVTLSLSKTLFDGGQSKNLEKQAELKIEQKKLQIKIQEQSIILDAIKKHLDAFVNLEVKRLRQKNLKKIEEEVKSNEAKFNVGAINKSIYSQSKAKFAKAKADLVQANKNYKNALTRYLVLTGDVADQLIFPDFPSIIPSNVFDAEKISKEHSYEVKLQQIIISQKKAEYRSLVSSVMPSLSTSLSASVTDSVSANHNESFSLSLSFKSPIFYTPATQSKNRQIAAELSALNYDLFDKKRNAILNAKIAFENYNASKYLIQASNEELQAFKTSLEIISMEKKLGSKTILDVLDAELNVINSEISLLRSKSNSISLAYSLISSLGYLDTESLGLEPTAPHYNKVEIVVPNLPSPLEVFKFLNEEN